MSFDPLKTFNRADSLFQRISNWLHARQDGRYCGNNIGRRARLGTAILDGNNSIGEDVFMFGRIRIGRHTTIGTKDILHATTQEEGRIEIGRYCQFGPSVSLFAFKQNMSLITPYTNFRLFNERLKEHYILSSISIGNGVLIGHRSIILSGVHIGNGAFVGAGSVVTKDVEDFGIAVGNPAKIVRRRFDDELLSLMIKWRWWDMEPSELQAYEHIFHIDSHKERNRLIDELRKVTT